MTRFYVKRNEEEEAVGVYLDELDGDVTLCVETGDDVEFICYLNGKGELVLNGDITAPGISTDPNGYIKVVKE